MIKTKRGQVTIFIIIGVILVALISGFFLLRNNVLNFNSPDKLLIKDQTKIIRSSVENCLSESAETVLYINSLQGGFYIPPKKSFVFEEENLSFYVPYYLSEEIINIPSQKELEQQISSGLEKEFFSCFDRLNSSFTNVNYNPLAFSSSVSFINDEVKIVVYFPIVVYSNSSSTRIDEFSYSTKSSLQTFFEVSSKLTLDQMKNPSLLCMSCIVDVSKVYDVQIQTEEFENNEARVIIYFLSKKDQSNHTSEMYSFAHKFNLPEGGSE